MANLNQQPGERLQRILDNQQQSLLSDGLKGIEKESLRITEAGMIAQTPHPKTLGSALTHACITTDYSEALLEFITPPFANIRDTLGYMNKIHRFVYSQLDKELLLATSMPCGLNGDLSVPIAQYGTSNIGAMKSIYRRGLWHRYGRSMQAIAGIHFNYSIPEALWPVLHKEEAAQAGLQQFINNSYFGLIRNFQKIGWLVLYLFGASPAICKSFFGSRPELITQFDEFDASTLYHPYATSLRMSDIGYKSKNQEGLKVDFNSVEDYITTLTQAISTPYPEYEKIGVKVDGEYKQLNSNILQIENEFYGTIRPKQVINSGEKPTLALKRRGVRYVEMRSLDINLYHPLGIEPSTAYFLEAFLLNCLLQESPPYSGIEQQINNQNQLEVAHNGRKPGLELNRQGQPIPLQDWANSILDEMHLLCILLDADNPDQPYSKALEIQKAAVKNPDLTPSARILADMRAEQQCFGSFALAKSVQNRNYFTGQTLSASIMEEFKILAANSIAKQKNLEANDQLSLDEFLKNYFAQV